MDARSVEVGSIPWASELMAGIGRQKRRKSNASASPICNLPQADRKRGDAAALAERIEYEREALVGFPTFRRSWAESEISALYDQVPALAAKYTDRVELRDMVLDLANEAIARNQKAAQPALPNWRSRPAPAYAPQVAP